MKKQNQPGTGEKIRSPDVGAQQSFGCRSSSVFGGAFLLFAAMHNKNATERKR